MKLENGISWCDATVNALTGCDKVSPGCKNCYAESGTRARVLRAQGRETWGAKGERVPVNFEPVFRRLNKVCICDKCHVTAPWLDDDGRMRGYQCVSCGAFALRRVRLFANSNSDFLDRKWPIEIFASFLDAIRLAPNIDVILLTKRIELFNERFEAVINRCDRMSPLETWLRAWAYEGVPPANVIGMVSVEDQKRADERIPLLLQTPFAVRGISIEPLLSSVDLSKWIGKKQSVGISFIIVGGESGPNRRDCGVEAIVSVAEQAIAAGIPTWVKQDSAFRSGQQGRIPDDLWKRKEFPSV